MATAKQIESNRRNAQRSTGPKTVAGRDRSKMNAWRHGLTATQITIDEQEARDFESFRDDLFEYFAPMGALEQQLVEDIAIRSWRLRRVPRLEIAETEFVEETPLGVRPPVKKRGYELLSIGFGQNLIGYEVRLHRMRQRDLHDLERLQARRRGEAVAAPVVVDVSHSIEVGGKARPCEVHGNGHVDRR